MVYTMYIFLILQFGWVLFSGAPTHKIRPLVLQEHEALREVCIGLPKFVAESRESRLLLKRFHILTVRTFLKIYASPEKIYIFINQSAVFFTHHWSRLSFPQVVFAQSLLDLLQVHLCKVAVLNDPMQAIIIEFDNIFPSNANNWCIHVGRESRCWYCIVLSPLHWSFSLLLPDFMPIFQAELLTIILAVQKLPQSLSVAILIACSLNAPNLSRALEALYSLLPRHLCLISLIWVSRHTSLALNECVDVLAVSSSNGPAISVLPMSAFVIAACFPKYATVNNFTKSALATSDFLHLVYPWKNQWRASKEQKSWLLNYDAEYRPPWTFTFTGLVWLSHRCIFIVMRTSFWSTSLYHVGIFIFSRKGF